MTMATWVDLPGLFPLDRNGSLAATQAALRVEGRDEALLQRHQADLLLLSLVLLFLVGSYLVCRCCRCRWLHRRRRRALDKTPGTRSHAYTMYQSNASGVDGRSGRGPVVMESVTSRESTATKKKPAKTKSVLVSEMEEPFLGPSDYAQPPPYELSPPAYDYLPSAPPLSDDASYSPRHM